MSLTLLGFSVAAAGCIKRIPLTSKELAEVQVKDAKDFGSLRVYTERKLLVDWVYKEQSGKGVQGVQDEKKGIIGETGSEEKIEHRIKRSRRGKIIKIDELNGRTILYVTFASRCGDPKCAYGFVETDDGKYRLNKLPERSEGYHASVWRSCVWKKRKMSMGKRASLAEPNEVWLVKKGNGKLLTMELDVKKQVKTRKQVIREEQDGID